MNVEHCAFCGATLQHHKFVCGYCGAYIGLAHTPVEEKAAIIEPHNLIMNNTGARQIDMIRNGFIPDTTMVLVDAGIWAMALVDTQEPNEPKNLAAVSRLEAIAFKLSLAEKSPETAEALKEFRRVLRKFSKYGQAINVLAVLIVMAVLAPIVFGIYKCSQ